MQVLSCYNEATKNAPALLATAGSAAELVTGLKENKSDMAQDSTPLPPSTKEIPLSKGKVALVDADDYTRVSAYPWHAVLIRGVWYARSARGGSLHKFILGVRGDQWVDHENGDGLDNRKSNLRLATPSQNARNRRKTHKACSSKYKGVAWDAKSGKWLASICKDRRLFNIGRFEVERDAASAYDSWAVKLHGAFARLNFPDETPAPARNYKHVNSSPYRGVSWNKRKCRWWVIVQKDKARHFGGMFTDEVEAAKAYDRLARELGLPESKLNFPR